MFQYSIKVTASGVPGFATKVATYATEHNLTIVDFYSKEYGSTISRVEMVVEGEIADIHLLSAYVDGGCKEPKPEPRAEVAEKPKKKFNLFKWWGV